MEYWRDDTLFFYFAAFVVLIVCSGNTNGCVFRGNSYEAARLTEDGIVISNRNTQVPVRMFFLALCMIMEPVQRCSKCNVVG